MQALSVDRIGLVGLAPDLARIAVVALSRELSVTWSFPDALGREAGLAAVLGHEIGHAIARHGAGASRVNVGLLEGGSGRNVIADRAVLKLEVRGETTPICQWMAVEAERVLRAAAAMHRLPITVLRLGHEVLALAEAAVYLATAPKSNRVYEAWKAAMELAREHGQERRHHAATLVYNGQRVLGMDPGFLSQASLMAVFRLNSRLEMDAVRKNFVAFAGIKDEEFANLAVGECLIGAIQSTGGSSVYRVRVRPTVTTAGGETLRAA